MAKPIVANTRFIFQLQLGYEGRTAYISLDVLCAVATGHFVFCPRHHVPTSRLKRRRRARCHRDGAARISQARCGVGFGSFLSGLSDAFVSVSGIV